MRGTEGRLCEPRLPEQGEPAPGPTGLEGCCPQGRRAGLGVMSLNSQPRAAFSDDPGRGPPVSDLQARAAWGDLAPSCSLLPRAGCTQSVICDTCVPRQQKREPKKQTKPTQAAGAVCVQVSACMCEHVRVSESQERRAGAGRAVPSVQASWMEAFCRNFSARWSSRSSRRISFSSHSS